jgi:hypothetical protein
LAKAPSQKGVPAGPHALVYAARKGFAAGCVKLCSRITYFPDAGRVRDVTPPSGKKPRAALT